MTEKELKQYRALIKLRDRKNAELEELECRDVPVVAGKVKGSMHVHPYTEVRTSVQMYDPREMEHVNARIEKCRRELRDIQNRITAIEQYIEGISDASVKVIFEMRVYDGKMWNDIAAEMDEGLSRKAYSRRFYDFIKN